MATLNAAQRDALPDSDFALVRTMGGKKQRDYPIHTRDHAVAALGRVETNGTDSEKQQVKAAVCKRYSDLPACSANTTALKNMVSKTSSDS